MKRLNTRYLPLALAFAASGTLAAVRPGTPFADGMVLQRDANVAVWGTADPGEAVKVSFAGNSVSTKADASGRWRVALPAMGASKESRTMEINDLLVRDVLVGEVWLCSGQSNAEMPLVSQGPHFSERQGRLVAQMTRKPYIRYVYASDYKFSVKPKTQADYPVVWKKFMPGNLGKDPSFSAMGVYFALELYSALDVPIGIVGACQGGTNIDAWTPRSGYAGKESLKAVADWKVVDKDGWKQEMSHMPIWEVHQQPTVLWNEMVQPWCPMTMRGFIWYQGCHNAREAHLYCAKMHALYDGWKTEFENPDLKLYFVQLAPYSDDWYDIQLAQAKFAAEEPNASMATTVDIGCWDDIHPGDKLPVGKRLAALAMQHDYGFADVVGEPPVFKSAEVRDGKAILTFDNAKGWYVRNDDWSLLSGFELKDDDGTWKAARLVNADHGAKERKPYATSGWVDGDKIVLEADGVARPAGVRYLHEKPWQGSLLSVSGLALGPFEADFEN